MVEVRRLKKNPEGKADVVSDIEDGHILHTS